MKIMCVCRLGFIVTIAGIFSANRVLLVHSSIAYTLHLCYNYGAEEPGKKLLGPQSLKHLFGHMMLGM